jgi:D-alanyl-D-alanine carboxypeptidase
VLVLNGWEFQNPQINGYVSIQAYLPARKIALSVTSTEGESAAKTTANYSSEMFKAIAAYLTPRHPAEPEA